ncbi:MAG TPA: nuclear transport factor 2 family protein [Gemmatimonadales bacterium]|jgi:ketosteroid isomerase-like protein|nr:nuclear transport factor 2 family protein [Gemmatimonadales bacterium]
MSLRPPRLPLALLLLTLLPARLAAQSAATTDSAAITAIRETVRQYDNALRRADVAALERIWAPEFTFVNPRGERLTRADRLANVRTGRTTFDSLAPAPKEESIRVYGDVAVLTTLLTLKGRYSGKDQSGRFRALVVWVHRDGRWQQVANQLTAVAGP